MTDWYMGQMKTKTYTNQMHYLFHFTHDQYVGDKLDYVAFIQVIGTRWDNKIWLIFYKKNPKSTVIMQNRTKRLFYQQTKSNSSW
jgi:hypothetical protein